VPEQDSPLESFRHALAGASRALARETEVEVSFTTDAPVSAGKQLKVPLPARNLPERDVAEARGSADSAALKASPSRRAAARAPVAAGPDRARGVRCRRTRPR
jgi:cobaltochelatase CobT